jgi:N-acetylmuramate 1-kinase
MDTKTEINMMIKPVLAPKPEEEVLRQKEIDAFLKDAGLQEIRKIRISGDASNRRYQRIFSQGESYMLMDSPVDKEPVAPFIKVDALLLERGFSAPKIIKQDESRGLLLLEDFGNTLFSKFFHEAAVEDEQLVQQKLYREAVNILIALSQQGLEGAFACDDIPHYSEDILEREAGAFGEWFLPEILKGEQLKEAQHSWTLLWRYLISSADLTPEVLVLRDYHVDNLCWLQEREGLQRVGLLDFQDALRGSKAYDLVSLLEDARRDVPPALQALLKSEYIAALGLDEAKFNRDYALYGAQRNAKILGYFVRLYRRDGKPRYLAMIERVWTYFLADIEHPSLNDVQQWIQKYFDHDARRAVSDIAKISMQSV